MEYEKLKKEMLEKSSDYIRNTTPYNQSSEE